MPGSRTRIIRNARIAASDLPSVFVRLMQIINDMAVVNDSLREWNFTKDNKRLVRKANGNLFFVRLQMAQVFEALSIIAEIRNSDVLRAEVEKCEKRTQDCFDKVCKFLTSSDYQKLLRVRNNVGFHYDGKLAERSVKELAEKFPEDTSSMSIGSDPLDWYFELGDKVTERIVIRHIFQIPEREDAKKESNAIGNRIFDMAEQLAEFAGYFIWERTTL